MRRFAYNRAQENNPYTPNVTAQEIAAQYCRDHGFPPPQETPYVQVNPEIAKRIAAVYADAPDSPQDPNVQAAWGQLAAEVQEQWNILPVAVEAHGDGFVPYKTSEEMMDDVMNNAHLWVYNGGDDHAFFSREQNFRFRAVHDFFGHCQHGYAFGPRGEENAWMEYSKMFTPLARAALTTETRGQNSWVNFGPYSHLPVQKRPYAQQKVFLLPGEFQTNAALQKAYAKFPDFIAPVRPTALNRGSYTEIEDVEISRGEILRPMMKGIVTAQGEFFSWKVERDGFPHHAEVAEHLNEVVWARLVFFPWGAAINDSEMRLYPDSIPDMLRYFDPQFLKGDVHFEVETADTSYFGTIADFKHCIKVLPPPDTNDYENGEDDEDFIKDLFKWNQEFSDCKRPETVRQMIGRGGPEDIYSGFSVYENPPSGDKMKKYLPVTKGRIDSDWDLAKMHAARMTDEYRRGDDFCDFSGFHDNFQGNDQEIIKDPVQFAHELNSGVFGGAWISILHGGAILVAATYEHMETLLADGAISGDFALEKASDLFSCWHDQKDLILAVLKKGYAKLALNRDGDLYIDIHIDYINDLRKVMEILAVYLAETPDRTTYLITYHEDEQTDSTGITTAAELLKYYYGDVELGEGKQIEPSLMPKPRGWKPSGDNPPVDPFGEPREARIEWPTVLRTQMREALAEYGQLEHRWEGKELVVDGVQGLSFFNWLVEGDGIAMLSWSDSEMRRFLPAAQSVYEQMRG